LLKIKNDLSSWGGILETSNEVRNIVRYSKSHTGT